MSILTFDSRVHGIPCQIQVESYSPAQAQTWDDPSWPAEAEFVVLDTRGRRAEWLERKMDDAYWDNLHSEVITKIEEQKQSQHERDEEHWSHHD